jgi:hypothetical protein
MLHEYAVEPESLGRFNAIWQALEQFGVPYGRLIADFPPRRWQVEVWKATASCPDLERKTLEERLIRLKGKLKNSERHYDFQRTWRENAHLQQAEQPFRGVIQRDNARHVGFVLTEYDFHEENVLWNIRVQDNVERSPKALAACIAPLGAISQEILFVDPYFTAEQKWIAVFLECLRCCIAAGSKFRRIEVHSATRTPLEFFEKAARQYVSRKLPPHVEVGFFVWRKLEGCEKLHARYVLTERGGIRIDVGLDAGKPGETTDVSLLSQDLYKTRWCEFQRDSGAFELVGEFKICSTATVKGKPCCERTKTFGSGR